MQNGLDEIQVMRDRQLTWGLYAASILGFIVMIGSLSRILHVGWNNSMYLHIFFYILILGTTLLTRYLPYYFRASIIVGVSFILGIGGLVFWGLAGLGIVALFTFCILSTILFGDRTGIISAIISIASIGIIGIGVVKGILIFDFDAEMYLTSYSSWILAMLSMALSAGIIVVALGIMNRKLTEQIETLDTRNLQLSEAKKRIENDFREHKRLEKERRLLEASLQRAQKMETVGIFAGGVAHDLNNILTSAICYPELLLSEIPQDSQLREPLETIKKSGIKAATMVNDLLTLARRGAAINEVTNLNLVVSEFFVSPEFEKIKSFHPKVDIDVHLEEDLINIIGSPFHLMKVLMNLVSNAAEAMPEGGTISISTENCSIRHAIKGYEEIEEGDYTILTVSDTGTGISSEDMERIFEPFYTKKVMGRSGTGLGMAVVWNTIKDHKGYLDVESKEGKGTTFFIFFPISKKSLPKTMSHLPFLEYLGNGESILVIDDIEEQREITSKMLHKLGYSVETVSSGEEAIEYLKKESADLLILNMNMEPKMDGLDTYKEIIKIHPGQKAIIASGYLETERVKEAQKLGAGAYLKKPYVMEKAGLVIKAELDRC